ncbi:MAG: single-stranded-DNA-specific exonuclease RecJ [Blautia sp.]|nr:single-stranded-DNA-specific exonuclease RecJ [Blautia sp.]
MEKWVVTAKKADFQSIGTAFGIDPVIARLIHNRDVVGAEQIRAYLHGTLEDLPSPWMLKDMDKAVELLGEKIRTHEKIRIIGDYDIDGVMASYILLEGLRRLGAEADICIPDRIADGYGIHAHLIEKAAGEGIGTILTCDNGISAVDEIRLAKEKGMTVIVTDHHEVPYDMEDGEKIWKLPPADALIDPKQADCPYPYDNICGAVVAWKLIQALYERQGIPAGESMAFLEPAAIATVGDVMDLQGENRIIVREGLKLLPETDNTGLAALIRACGLEGKKITAYHIGFVLGPCLNASGRLDTALRSLELMQEKDSQKAAVLAEDLVALNESRKAMTEEGREQAEKMVRESSLAGDKVLVVFLPDCHESLAGIIAGRLRETFHRPSIVLTRSENGVKGSGRSIEAYSMFDELSRCKDLLDQFGGHPMAAGLSMQEENIEPLRRRLNENASLTVDDLTEKIIIDAAMPIAYLSRRLVGQMALLEPFGKGNTKPLFAQKDLHAVDLRVLGRNKNVCRVRLQDKNGVSIQAVFFGDAPKFQEDLSRGSRVAVTYYPEINEYQGRENLQIVIQNYKAY